MGAWKSGSQGRGLDEYFCILITREETGGEEALALSINLPDWLEVDGRLQRVLTWQSWVC